MKCLKWVLLPTGPSASNQAAQISMLWRIMVHQPMQSNTRPTGLFIMELIAREKLLRDSATLLWPSQSKNDIVLWMTIVEFCSLIYIITECWTSNFQILAMAIENIGLYIFNTGLILVIELFGLISLRTFSKSMSSGLALYKYVLTLENVHSYASGCNTVLVKRHTLF